MFRSALLLPPLLPKVVRLQEYTVPILYRTVIIQCVEKWHKSVPGKGTMHETSLFLLDFLKVGP